jgi:hypothetical protein
MLKVKNFKIYKFHYLKFTFSHVWDPGSEIQDSEKNHPGSRILGVKKHRILDSGSATLHENKTKQKSSKGICKKATHSVYTYILFIQNTRITFDN